MTIGRKVLIGAGSLFSLAVIGAASSPQPAASPSPTPSKVLSENVKPSPRPSAISTHAPTPTPIPTPTPSPTPTPKPTIVARHIATPTPQPPAQAPAPNCDPNYSGACVPNVYPSDVDCAGGSGNGPYYVQGPIKVIGVDRYKLDSGGNGVGCE